MGTPPVMPSVTLDAPRHDGGIIYHCKTHLNIENIGHKYDFEVGWGGWTLFGSGGSSSKERNLTK